MTGRVCRDSDYQSGRSSTQLSKLLQDQAPSEAGSSRHQTVLESQSKPRASISSRDEVQLESRHRSKVLFRPSRDSVTLQGSSSTPFLAPKPASKRYVSTINITDFSAPFLTNYFCTIRRLTEQCKGKDAKGKSNTTIRQQCCDLTTLNSCPANRILRVQILAGVYPIPCSVPHPTSPATTS